MKVFLTLIFCLFISQLSAQQPHLAGTIVDHSTQKALAEVSLTVLQKQTGTVSNNEGKFMLLKNNILDTDSVLISCIGYRSITKLAAQLMANQSQLIYLEPQVFVLEEVIIKPLSVVAMLKEAIETTAGLIKPENRLNAYYKEFAYLDQALFKFADAAVIYTVDDKDKKTKVDMQVIESRIKKDSVTEENKWKSDIESLIKSDKAMKSYYNLDYLNKLVNPKHTDKFTYKIENSGPITKISIDPKAEIKQYLPNVTVYFNTVNNRILKVNYSHITHLQYMPKVNLVFMAYACEKDNMTAIYSEGPVP
ncbi:carboxypeptidase-like regulatory domain-containing protein, partial [Pedobacter sp.]|uniref:carboxypeptidase-like regulatory domain-containing protein n=1 Tax=Pedobacter sp. TaxID=1411316 RepID=UPI003D7F6FB5